jgi:hypothetical protein
MFISGGGDKYKINNEYDEVILNKSYKVMEPSMKVKIDYLIGKTYVLT